MTLAVISFILLAPAATPNDPGSDNDTSNANNVSPDPDPDTNVLEAPAGSDNRPVTTLNGIVKPRGQNYINVPQILNISDDEYNGYLVNIFNVYYECNCIHKW